MSMPPATIRSGLFASLRSRVVAIAVVPSLVFVCAVIGVGWYRSDTVLTEQSTAGLVGEGVDVTAGFNKAVLDERRISVEGSGDLSAARTSTDKAAAGARAFLGRLPDTAPTGVRESFTQLGTAVEAVSRARRDIDSGARDRDAYEAYEPVVEPLNAVVGARTAPGSDLDVVIGMSAAGNLLAVVESVHSADLVVAADGPRGLDVPAYRELTAEAGQIGEAMQYAVAGLPDARRDAGTALLDTPEWRTFTADTELLLAAGPRGEAPAGGQADNQRGGDRGAADRAAAVAGELTAAGDAVAAKASDLAYATAHDAVTVAVDRAGTALNVIVGIVLGMVAVIVGGMLLAMRTGNRLGRRMAGLRAAAHGTSARLPDMLDRIRRGEPVDIDAEFPVRDYGTDEIGEVGTAVEEAQRSAVAAAAEEARTRAGANAVFLNIAHRSQAIVHRQLQVLDEAERAENDSDQLARLYQLDHLSTRERRNAENLIIMGGQQPRRRWRRPVPVAEIIRSAVSESEQYTRITLGDIPHRYVDGGAVGDLIHLLAELVDNATSFSPPQCPIDITASVVGRGVAVEIEDRGLGIEPEPRARINQMLTDRPDFGLLTLSEDSRLGLFVVSRLGRRHGVRVTLRESTYGGVQALVLVPNTLLVAQPDDDGEVEEPLSGPADGESDGRTGSHRAGTNGRHPGGEGSNGGLTNGQGANGHLSSPEALPRQRGGSAARMPSSGTPQATPTSPAASTRGTRPALPERIPGGGATPAARRGAEPSGADVAPADVAPADVAPADVAPADVAAAHVAGEVGAPAQAAASPSAASPADVQAASAAAPSDLPGADDATSGAALPPLPERRPQGHLVKGLRGRPAAERDTAAEAAEPAAGRSSNAMSAMQRGVRSSRGDAAEDGGRK